MNSSDKMMEALNKAQKAIVDAGFVVALTNPDSSITESDTAYIAGMLQGVLAVMKRTVIALKNVRQSGADGMGGVTANDR